MDDNEPVSDPHGFSCSVPCCESYSTLSSGPSSEAQNSHPECCSCHAPNLPFRCLHYNRRASALTRSFRYTPKRLHAFQSAKSFWKQSFLDYPSSPAPYAIV